MKVCNHCETTLWTSDKGFCPLCNPIENAKIYGLKPFLFGTRFEVKEEVEAKLEGKPLLKSIVEPITLDDVVKAHIIKVYDQCGKNKAKTSKRLNITVRTLYNHLTKYGVV